MYLATAKAHVDYPRGETDEYAVICLHSCFQFLPAIKRRKNLSKHHNPNIDTLPVSSDDCVRNQSVPRVAPPRQPLRETRQGEDPTAACSAQTHRRGVPPCTQRVQYPDAIEPLVQFIEETPPAEILDRTLEKLRAGVPTQTMLTASALAVTRSSDLPPGHHGGPLHPLAGLYAITNLVERLEGEDKFLPVLQHVALSNKHINDPATWPFSCSNSRRSTHRRPGQPHRRSRR